MGLFVLKQVKLTHLLLCIIAPAECIVNVKLSEANRASGNLRKSFLECDVRNLKTIGKWHQFVGEAGTKIPNSCVPTQRCGTHAPGWMKDAHPKKEDGVVKRKICFHWSGNCCRWSVDIDVRNCGSHYVYKLVKPPACYLRFCGDKGHSKYKMIAHLRNLVGLIFFKEKQNVQQQHSKNLLKLFLCSPNILCVLLRW